LTVNFKYYLLKIYGFKWRTVMTHKITAPLDGKVCQLRIKAGDKVEEDEEILVIEAMKTETPLFSPCNGVVADVRINEEDDVAEKEVLAIIEEKNTGA